MSKLGHRFASESDTEVVLAAYAEWGSDCQLRFNGMWAFAIWDAYENRLFISRDRFGVKPVHYANVDGCFSFASELKSFLELSWCDGTLDRSVLGETIRNIVGQECTPHTYLRNVKRLPAGHSMTVGPEGLRVIQWWNTIEHLPTVPQGLPEQSDHFRDLFLDACRLRLRSDVAIATSLSGGLDSSSVACAISELARRGSVDHVPADWHRAFIGCFPGTALDERNYAEEIVSHTGMRPQYCVVDDKIAVDGIEKIIFDLEDIWYVPLVAAWAIYREMQRQGIKVSLDGHGADELLGGYHFFVEAAIKDLYGRAFKFDRWLDLNRVRAGLAGGTRVGGSGELLPRAGIRSDIQGMAGGCVRWGLERLGILEPLRRFRTHGQSKSGYTSIENILPPWCEPKLLCYGGQPVESNTSMKTLQQKMLFEFFHLNVLPTFLRCIDRASMAHGIEVRMPFMDWRLVTLSFALPDESKIGGGYTKRILRSAMDGLMPDGVRLRTKKIHFSSPINDWARQGLRSWLLDLANSRAFLEASIWNGKAARRAIEQAAAGQGSIDPVWPIVNAHILQEQFQSKARSARTPVGDKPLVLVDGQIS